MAHLLATVCLLLLVLQLRHCATQSVPPPLSGLDLDYASLRSFIMNQTIDPGAVENPCAWPGVECRLVPTTVGVKRIRKLTISGIGLNGTIPAGTLGNLEALQYLNLSQNSLFGAIPEDLWALENLTILDLSCNRLSGNISDSVGMALSLRRLDLSCNVLEGPIPAAFGRLANLQFLNLGRNPLGGVIPSQLFNCTLLRSLDLSDALLQGYIPGAMSELFALRSANLSSNMLTGPVPNITRLNKLVSLSLSNNSLSGVLPTYVPGALRDLDLSLNNLEDVVSQFPDSWLSLEYLDLSSNPNLGAGTFPSNLASFLALRYFSISGCNFSASTFPPIFALRNLTHLDLGSSFLSGYVPSELGRLTNLQTLNLNRNNLSGRIPIELGSLSNLSILDLSVNGLEGTIPPQLASLTQLSSMNLSYNNLSGGIPEELSSLSNLTSLDLSHNKLEGIIPSQLTSLNLLRSLNLSYNNLSGPIPDGWLRFNETSFEGNLGICYGCQLGFGLYPVSAPSGAPLVREFKSNNRYRLKTAVIIGIVAGCVVALFIVAAGLCWRRRIAKKAEPADLIAVPQVSRAVRRQMSSQEPFSVDMEVGSWTTTVRDPNSVPVVLFEKPLLHLTLADLYATTSFFSRETQISDGIYGPTYKGFLPHGLLVAIRVVTDETGFRSEKEAGAQLEALGRVKHTNIVPLLGYCVTGKQRILVHAFIVDGDLHRKLHDLPEGVSNTEDWSKDTWDQLEGDACGDSLGWEARHRIALGLARALSFLHHACSPHIVHTNVRASNVLLDADHEPYLADCGLPSIKASKGDQEWPAIGNSPGYMPPEYSQTSKASSRGDVYSFGVVLLELVTGKRPVGHSSFETCGSTLVGWVRSLICENQGYKALDLKLTSKGPLPEMLEALRIGYLCTAEAPSKRPSMQQAVAVDVRLSTAAMKAFLETAGCLVASIKNLNS